MMKIHDHELTDRQIEILSFIYDYQTDYALFPVSVKFVRLLASARHQQ